MPPSFLHHLHPPTIPAAQSRWGYTLGAGGISVFLMLMLGVTGILEMFYYIPDPQKAALSVQTITYLVPLGGLVRNLHYWSGQLLMVFSGLHLLRVIFTGAYTPLRRFNYLLGLVLFVGCILLNFTGYILRWDVNICYPLLTGTNLLKTIPGIGGFLYELALGGEEACTGGLFRFYIWHIFGLAAAAFIMLVWHVFRVRRDGGIALPPPRLRADSVRITRNELVRREVLAMLGAGAALLVLSSFIPAPIAAAMTGGGLTGESRAPWFFLWIQQLLKWGDPFFLGIVIPFGMLLILALIPFLFPKPAEEEVGRWFPKSSRLVQITAVVMVLILLSLTLAAYAS
ncbi:MAG TPA: cytochrome b N-terminal domain-containing protein [Anaerolineales bacterium]